MLPIPKHPRYLLSQQFQRMHGLTVEQALAGNWVTPGREQRVMSPDEHDEYWRPVLKDKYVPWADQVQQATQEQHQPETLLRDWAMDHRGFLVDTHPPRTAARVRDFTKFVEANSVPNEAPIYRGARRSPQVDAAEDPDFPLSFTEDRHVATSFKAAATRGAIFKMAPHTARGVRLADYGVDVRTVGQNRRRESEFLVDPISIHNA